MWYFIKISILLLTFAVNGNCLLPTGMLGSAVNGVKNVYQEVENFTSAVLPGATALFAQNKKLLLGYPLEFLTTVINEVCKLRHKENTCKYILKQ